MHHYMVGTVGSNHADLIHPYAATIVMQYPLSRRRAALPDWSIGGEGGRPDVYVEERRGEKHRRREEERSTGGEKEPCSSCLLSLCGVRCALMRCAVCCVLYAVCCMLCARWLHILIHV